MEAEAGAGKAAGTLTVQTAAWGLSSVDLRCGEATPRTIQDTGMIAFFSKMIAFFAFCEFESGTADLIPLGINQHWIVIAQSVRKGEPLNPNIRPLESHSSNEKENKHHRR